MYHTSPTKIEKIHGHGVAGDCLFFSDSIYVMGLGGYVVYEADFDCISASQLYDAEIVKEIADRCGVEEELAEALLDASECEWDQDFDCDADFSWWLQGKRGECAKKMGYDGCKDTDEQGCVYIIPMTGRESDLRLVKEVRE